MKKQLLVIFALLGSVLVGGALVEEVFAADYAHIITLMPDQYETANIHLNEGDVVDIYAESFDGTMFCVFISNPHGERVFEKDSCSVMDVGYIAPATGNYGVELYNPNFFSDVTVGYTITRVYRGRFGITRHQDIKVSGSEF